MRSVSEIGTTPGDAQTEASTPQEKCPKREAWSRSAAPKTTNILEARGVDVMAPFPERRPPSGRSDATLYRDLTPGQRAMAAATKPRDTCIAQR
ncbi:hypothetical protein IscW_ISCW013944 [Ixodes scapularis]|uniref:Uncharacterized protein n=1 Tax=Ixodes scapularis TaxID=6945 RepID=B7QKZ6_IXOSC|nr:hypothetical protein IscW_ISCW013944 [Ixodes scapularis]|eukprot:XP_002415851.1 hypothetical protein IscW_ISCW013944 [Ixodes scapularis]